MRNLLLLLILVSGLLAGYLIGDFRGKEARKALELAIEKGKILDKERLTTIAKLEADLSDTHAKYKQQIDALNKVYDGKETKWRETVAGLEATIGRLKAKRTAIETELKELIEQLNSATGEKKEAVAKRIETLKKMLAEIQVEIDGNQCFKTPVPGNVVDLLNIGEKK